MAHDIKNRLKRDFPNTLNLIEKWIADYKPAPRKGVPRGMPIPPSKQRYSAAAWVVLDLKKLSLKEVAKLTGAPYSTVRVWRTEETFQSLHDEFCEFIIEAMVKIAIKTNREVFQDIAGRKKHLKFTAQLARECIGWSEYAKERLFLSPLTRLDMYVGVFSPEVTSEEKFKLFIGRLFYLTVLEADASKASDEASWEALRTMVEGGIRDFADD
jgi:hypothetical protein